MDRQNTSMPAENLEITPTINGYLNEAVDEIQGRIKRTLKASFVGGYNVGFCDFAGKYADSTSDIIRIITEAFTSEGYSVIGQRNDFGPDMKITEIIGDYTINSLVLTKDHCSLGAIGLKAVRVKKKSKVCVSWDVWNYYHNVLDDLV